jgi:hypothetical protein
MKNRDEIMSNKELRNIFMAHVAENRVLLESAVDKYDEAWYDVRSQLAEYGMELTPDELEETIELIRDCLKLLDGKSK